MSPFRYRIAALPAAAAATLALLAACASPDPVTPVSPSSWSTPNTSQPAPPPATHAEPASSTDPPPPPEPLPVAVGTTLLEATGDGRLTVVMNEDEGFTFLNSVEYIDRDPHEDASTFIVYDTFGNRTAEVSTEEGFNGECGLADVGSGLARTVLTQNVVLTPAAGLKPATGQLNLTAWDPDGSKRWTTTLLPASEEHKDFTCVTGAEGSNLDGVRATRDGRYALVRNNPWEGQIVELATGKLSTRPYVQDVLGNWFIVGEEPPYALVEPGTWRKLATLPDIFPLGQTVDTEQNVSFDGKVLIGTVAVPSSTYNGNYEEWRAWALPSMKQLYVLKENAKYSEEFRGIVPGLLLMTRTATTGGAKTTVAFDDRTGKQRWSLPVYVDVCGATPSQLLVRTEDQLVTLDVKTGKELSYTSEGSAGCPGSITRSGLQLYSTTVTQALLP